MIRILLAASLLISLAAGATQLDLLQYENESHKTISLSGLTPTTAWKIAETNDPLKPWEPINIADLGHFISDRIREIKQSDGPTDIPTNLINFTKSDVPITPSIDTVPDNDDVTPVNTEEEGLLYL
jgi:hypothetical protein